MSIMLFPEVKYYNEDEILRSQFWLEIIKGARRKKSDSLPSLNNQDAWTVSRTFYPFLASFLRLRFRHLTSFQLIIRVSMKQPLLSTYYGGGNCQLIKVFYCKKKQISNGFTGIDWLLRNKIFLSSLNNLQIQWRYFRNSWHNQKFVINGDFEASKD